MAPNLLGNGITLLATRQRPMRYMLRVVSCFTRWGSTVTATSTPFTMGQRVQCRHIGEEWNVGEVTNTCPLAVKCAEDWIAWVYDEVRPLLATAFLPMELDGKKVLVKEAENQWRVTNANFKGDTDALAYRSRKDVKARLLNIKGPTWETLVRGSDEGDGWLKCDLTQATEDP